jgi:hypothetical protein
MMELMRDIYRKEFSNIPEKKRPKPKAYVARAAWYKKEGPERDKYIESWILADRDAAEARMGKNVVKKRIEEKEEFSNDYVMDTLPSIVSTANSASANSFKPSTDTLKERAAVAIDKLNELTNETQAKVMSKIKAPIVRGSAKYLFRETRKLNRKLAKEIRKEARQLEAAAKRHVLSESKDAFHKLEKKAEVNLTAALNGRAPTKRMTHRLARIRNSGRGVPVETFLNSEKRKGRFTNKKNPLPKNSNFQNNYSNI